MIENDMEPEYDKSNQARITYRYEKKKPQDRMVFRIQYNDSYELGSCKETIELSFLKL